jgi:hypothetical protein
MVNKNKNKLEVQAPDLPNVVDNNGKPNFPVPNKQKRNNKNISNKTTTSFRNSRTAFDYTDLTSKVIGTLKENTSIQDYGVSAVRDSSEEIKGSIRINFGKLRQQANVFANQMLSNSNIVYYRLFDMKGIDQHRKCLEQMYIYSYAKAYLYGSRPQTSGSIPPRTIAFWGHALMFLLLEKKIIDSISDNDVHIRKYLYVNDADHKFNIEGLRKNFRFLPDTSDYTNYYVYSSPKYDRWMNGLNSEQSSWVSFGNLDDVSYLNQHIVGSGCPLFNSAYSDLNENKLLYILCPPGTITSRNISFCKACFIYVHNQDTVYENCYYRSYMVEKLDRLTKYDVESITSLVPKLGPMPFEIVSGSKENFGPNRPLQDDSNDSTSNSNKKLKNNNVRSNSALNSQKPKSRKFDFSLMARRPGGNDSSEYVTSDCIGDIDLSDIVTDLSNSVNSNIDISIDKEQFVPFDYSNLSSLDDEEKKIICDSIINGRNYFSPSNFIFDESNGVIASRDLRTVIANSFNGFGVSKSSQKSKLTRVDLLRAASLHVLKSVGIITKNILSDFMLSVTERRFKSKDMFEVKGKDNYACALALLPFVLKPSLLNTPLGVKTFSMVK